MRHLLMRCKVADYDRWEAVYDAARFGRDHVGLREHDVFRNLNDPNEVFILFGFDDLMKVEEYVASPAVKETLRLGGVADAPDFYFLT